MTFTIDIPGPNAVTRLELDTGASVVFCGANGSGKTRLAVHIETELNQRAHRVSAHRALTLNPSVPKIAERSALAGLRWGYPDATDANAMSYRSGHRWHQNAAVSLLNDFDFLVQALFADQANKALETHKGVRAGTLGVAEPTKFERLTEIWHRLLPHRRLEITGDDIRVRNPQNDPAYPASEMSDGERAIFYLIGQALLAAEGALLIVDEPELHVHRSILARLWDELETVRHDAAFVFITHDLEFAVSRIAQQFIVRDYDPATGWLIESVPPDSGVGEEFTTLILGSRQPILFVEGTDASLDHAMYRCCFPDRVVAPRGSCDEVIHSVVSMRRNAVLTRVTCSGIVDADHHQPDEVAALRSHGVTVLPVAEIENIVLLPKVSRAIAESEGYKGSELEDRLNDLKVAVFDTLSLPGRIDAMAARYCRRRIDRMLKKIDLSDAPSVASLEVAYRERTGALDVAEVAAEVTQRVQLALQQQDLPGLLAHYDNKELLALAARCLKKQTLPNFKRWLIRVLRNGAVPALNAAIRECLPTVPR